MANDIAYANMLFYPLYYNTISLTILKTTQAFHLLLGFAENQIVFWDFTIWNSVQIAKGSDNGDSDNWSPTVPWFISFYEHGVCICLCGACSGLPQ